MNKYIQFMAFAMLAVFSLTFTSCGDDDDNGGGEKPSYTKTIVSTGTVSDIDYRTATLYGTWNSDLTLLKDSEIGFIVSDSQKKPSADSSEVYRTYEIEGNVFKVELDDLSPGTEYYYRAYALVNGIYQYGDVQKFITKSVEDNFSTGAATDIGYNTATLNASCNIEASLFEENSYDSGYGFVYSATEKEPDRDNAESVISNNLDGKCFSAKITGLKSKTTYYYRACVMVDYKVKYGKVQTFTTQSISSVLTTGAATNITFTTATLAGTWNTSIPTTNADYGIIVGTSSEPTISNATKARAGNITDKSFSVPVKGLKSGTKYYYRAYAIVEGEYQYGDIKSFTTQSITSVLTTGAATNITHYGATLSATWNTNISTDGADYGFVYSTSANPTINSGTKAKANNLSNKTYSVSLTGLNANSAYYYRAYAYVDGECQYGDVKSFTTESVPQSVAVDLGLSVMWAAYNVGATVSEDSGEYYAWGETETKENYSWYTYKWGGKTSLTKYNDNSSYGRTVDNKTVLDLEDDVAHVKWGGSWRMPTPYNWYELIANCTCTWTTQNGINGYKVTSNTNGNSIFLPATGSFNGTGLNGVGKVGYYWSRMLFLSSNRWIPSHASQAYFHSGIISSDGYDDRCYGRSVRPVCPK